MAIKAIQSSDYGFRVEAAPSFMQLPDGTFVKDGFTVNRRVDNLAVLGKVTDRYGIVQNDDLINAAEDAFAASGLTDYSRRIIVTGEGQKMYAVYDFKSHVKKLTKVGDEVGLTLTVQNSFDGSLRASFLAAIMRLICANGMTASKGEVGMTSKHGSKVSVAFVQDALQRALGAWDKSLFLLDRLADVRVTQLEGSIILANLTASKVLSTSLMEGIAGIWAAPTYKEDADRNLLNLYNAVTQYLTHEVAAERFELANRVTANVFAAFERASRDAGKLTKLVTPEKIVNGEVIT
jgi:hypothetical protein